MCCFIFFFQAEDGIRDLTVTGVQTCALPISIVGGGRGRLDSSDGTIHLPGQEAGTALLIIETFPSLWREQLQLLRQLRSEERRVGKSVDLGGRRIIKKKKERRTKESA